MQDVADRAGVSISTVSFLINGTKPVAPQTRDRVLKAIDELGYRRNAVARALASRRSRIIALLYPMMDRNLDRFVDAAGQEAAQLGYSLIVWPAYADRTGQAVEDLMQSGIADGVILLEVQMEDERVHRLDANRAPYVMIGRTVESDAHDYVDIDFDATVGEAVELLSSLGHRHVTLVVEDFTSTPLEGYAPPIRVESAFRSQITAGVIEGSVLRLARDVPKELLLADRILNETPDSTGVVMMHADAMFALANGLRHRGVSVPHDLSIVSIATAAVVGALIDPPVTTWDTPVEELGSIAARTLIDRLEGTGAPGSHTLIPCRRRDGASVARAPANAVRSRDSRS